MNPTKTMSATTVRRGLYGMFAGGLLAFGSAAIVMPVANAAPDSCSQSGIATTASSVSASTAAYLAAHPQTNQELTDIAKQGAIRPRRPTGRISIGTRRSRTSCRRSTSRPLICRLSAASR